MSSHMYYCSTCDEDWDEDNTTKIDDGYYDVLDGHPKKWYSVITVTCPNCGAELEEV